MKFGRMLRVSVVVGLALAGFAGCEAKERPPIDENAFGGEGGGTDLGGRSGGPASGGTGGTVVGDCQPGDLRCSSRTPEKCSDAGEWVATRAACAVACLEGRCVECAPDSTVCKDGAVQICEDGGWVTDEVCTVCEDGACTDRCTDDRLQCNRSVLQRCEDGEYVDEEACEFACVGDECTGECEPDARRCNPDAPSEAQSCNAEGEWDGSVPCQNSTFCVNGDCKPCEPDSRRCGTAGPQLCSENGEWVNVGACMEPTAACFEGRCVPCAPGDKRCSENAVEECADDGTAWEVAETCTGDTPACLDATKECGTCSGDQTQCFGNIVKACNDEGAWEVLTACSGASPQCVDGQCAACSPTAGERRCLDEDTAQSCQTDGTWGGNTNCTGDTPVCREDLGFQCGCEDGARRCNAASRPEKCEGGAWVEQSACAGTLDYCLPATGECVDCQPGREECSSARVAQRCTEGGSWQSLNACSGTEVNCGGCGLGESCDGDDDCASNACVSDRCAACKPGSKECNGQTPRECTTEGTWNNLAACTGDNPVCLGSSARCGCASGTRRCVGDSSLLCNTEGAWGAAMECTGTTPACLASGACGVPPVTCTRMDPTGGYWFRSSASPSQTAYAGGSYALGTYVLSRIAGNDGVRTYNFGRMTLFREGSFTFMRFIRWASAVTGSSNPEVEDAGTFLLEPGPGSSITLTHVCNSGTPTFFNIQFEAAVNRFVLRYPNREEVWGPPPT